jgi:uncharacterized protein YjbI with pentapeptide repeats
VGQKKLVRKAEPPSKRGIRWPRWTGFRGKTAWDFLQLLIVPLMLVAIGLVFSLQQDARQQRVEDQRADAERELADQRAQDEALQAYLNQMSSLLLERNLREAEAATEVRILARARTLTVLNRLDPSRKTAVVQFLLEAELIQSVDDRGPIIRLVGADLGGAGVGTSNVLVRRGNLVRTDLSGANLGMSNLRNANLYATNLSGTNLALANLGNAKLWSTNLSGANLDSANLSNADLANANLSGANLNSAKLSNANLRRARGVTNEQLEKQAWMLEGATMPNGQKYEDWLQDN